jgi:hypothetical protein
LTGKANHSKQLAISLSRSVSEFYLVKPFIYESFSKWVYKGNVFGANARYLICGFPYGQLFSLLLTVNSA